MHQLRHLATKTLVGFARHVHAQAFNFGIPREDIVFQAVQQGDVGFHSNTCQKQGCLLALCSRLPSKQD